MLPIKNLVGKLHFTDDELARTDKALEGLAMPAFGNIGNALAQELSAEQVRDKYYADHEDELIRSQALIRGLLARRAAKQRKELYNNALEQGLRKFQVQAKGAVQRLQKQRKIDELKRNEATWIKLQAQIRGTMARRAFIKRRAWFRENEDKIILLQSVIRAKLANEAYKRLTLGGQPNVSVLRNFVNLLINADNDMEELELERLRQLVVKRIRENNMSEAALAELDIKIALLVKNRISLDEVVKAHRKTQRSAKDETAASTGPTLNLKALDKESRHKLLCYQQLFYMLQTQPTYLAKMLYNLNKSSMSEKTKKFMETVVLTLFGFAQNAREEYLLLKLFNTAIGEELIDANELGDFMRGNPVFVKLVVHYNRGAKERKYLRDLLQPLIKRILEDHTLDLETDPMIIYKASIKEEESRTGEKSTRPYEVNREEALNDPGTRSTFIKRLQQLRNSTEQFLDAIQAALPGMPYGIRYIAKALKQALQIKFPHENENAIMRVVGHLVYYRYMNPAIVAPEAFDVIETLINPVQRKNLAEISKMLNQVSVGKLFADENMYLQPLNDYVAAASGKFAKYFKDVTQVDEPEVQFGIDEYNDLAKTQKPIIYISSNEIFSVHSIIEENIDAIAPNQDDNIRIILKDLGKAPVLDEDQKTSQGNEISLTLINRFAEVKGKPNCVQR